MRKIKNNNTCKQLHKIDKIIKKQVNKSKYKKL